MESIETIEVESDENGWELHISTDEGEYRFNMHAVAEAHHDDVRATIGAWLAEGYAARAEQERAMRTLDAEDEEQWMHESAVDYYRRTGNAGPLLDQADDMRSRAKEGA